MLVAHSQSGETAFDFGRGSPDILDVLGPKPPSSAQAALGRPQRRCCYFHDREHEHPRGLRMQVGSVSKAVRERDAPGVTAAVAAGGCTEDASQVRFMLSAILIPQRRPPLTCHSLPCSAMRPRSSALSQQRMLQLCKHS